ncbi:MAG: ABC transporter permease, partial [Sphingomonadales bacterium]
MNSLSLIGRFIMGGLASLGHAAKFMGTSISHIVRPPIYYRLVIRQMMQIGYFSLPVVGMTALFTGAALAQQIYVGGQRFNAESTMAAVV